MALASSPGLPSPFPLRRPGDEASMALATGHLIDNQQPEIATICSKHRIIKCHDIYDAIVCVAKLSLSKLDNVMSWRVLPEH